jgi:hypothetical protein
VPDLPVRAAGHVDGERPVGDRPARRGNPRHQRGGQRRRLIQRQAGAVPVLGQVQAVVRDDHDGRGREALRPRIRRPEPGRHQEQHGHDDGHPAGDREERAGEAGPAAPDGGQGQAQRRGGGRPGGARVVGHHGHGQAVLVDQAAQQREHLPRGRRVEGAGRLVGEDDLRPGDQRPGDGDALLLAARQLARPVPGPVSEADGSEHRAHLAGLRRPASQPARQLHVLPGSQRGDEVERLEDEADPGAAQDRQRAGGQAAEHGARDADLAGGDAVEPGGALQQRGLA